MDAPARAEGPVPVAADDPLAALRAEVRRAGRSVARTQRALRPVFWVPFGVVVAVFIVGLAENPLSLSIPYGVGEVLRWILYEGAPVLLAVAPLLFVTPSLRQLIARRRLRGQLPKLPREQLGEALAELRSDPDEGTRRLAGALLRDLELRTEVTPSRAPDGRGVEVSVTDGRGA